MADFFLRVRPSREEMETLVRAGALDEFGLSRCAQFWECQQLFARWGDGATAGQGWLIPPPEIVGKTTLRRPHETTASAWIINRGSEVSAETTASADANRPESDADFHPFDSTFLTEPSRAQRLQCENELIGFPASGHPLELYPDIAWDTYCPVNRLKEFVGQEVTLCGFVVENRLHHQENGEPMKFLTLADWTGMIETELFAKTYKAYALTTVRYPVLEVTGRVEPFENGRSHTLRALRAGKPRPKR